jgi:hypothetical protein
MNWDEERKKIEQLIQANIDWNSEEIQFHEELLEILDASANKSSFLRKASREANDHPNIWLRDNLVNSINELKTVESIYN